MADIDWERLLKDMLVAAGDVAHQHGGEVLPCLQDRLEEIAKLASETASDYRQGYITQEQYQELEQDLEHLKEGAIQDCQDMGLAVVQAAVNAALDKLWGALRAVIKQA